MQRKYGVHIASKRERKEKMWRFIVKHPNGIMVCESRWYKNETYCRKVGEELYQCLKHGWKNLDK